MLPEYTGSSFPRQLPDEGRHYYHGFWLAYMSHQSTLETGVKCHERDDI